MIYDILDVFKKQYEEKGDKLILDNYILKDGLYIKINKDESLEYFIFKNSKNEKVKEYCFKDLNGRINSTMYSWFKERDYYSGYLNSNKAFGNKKIHNVNYLSLFIKYESFISSNPKKRLSYGAIEKQFNDLKTYKKFNKKEEKEILKLFNYEINYQNRLDDIDKKYFFIKKYLDTIIDTAKNNNIKNYIKIFFDEYIGRYKNESKFYYAIKIFNDIKYSKKIEDSQKTEEIWGPSDSNMGLNSKKPFLESKTKNNSIPFFITDENALMLKRFFDWLKFQKYKENYPLNEKLFIAKHLENGEPIIDDFDFIPNKTERLPESIYFKNYLMARDSNKLIEDNTIDLLWELEEKIDEIFYNNQLKNNYFNEVYKKLDNSFQNLIYITRAGMVNCFKKHDDRAFYQIVKKYGDDFILEHIKKSRILKAKLSLNLKFSLLVHKGETIMDVKAMQENIIKKLETSNYDSLKSDEFFYISGQVAKYLIGQSEVHEKKGNLLEPFLRSNNAQKIKKDIESTYFKYKHKISLNYVKFNNALSLIMAYEGEDKLSDNMDDFLVGALSDNIFYIKKEA
jgi:CRISPR-associated protein Csh1